MAIGNFSPIADTDALTDGCKHPNVTVEYEISRTGRGGTKVTTVQVSEAMAGLLLLQLLDLFPGAITPAEINEHKHRFIAAQSDSKKN